MTVRAVKNMDALICPNTLPDYKHLHNLLSPLLFKSPHILLLLVYVFHVGEAQAHFSR